MAQITRTDTDMDKYTASNGVTVHLDDARAPYAVEVASTRRVVSLAPSEVLALRESFQAARDEELGRWRWPEKPDYVVYPNGEDDDGVLVVYEPGGGNSHHFRSRVSASGFPADAATAYFEAHPEPKPWSHAQPGEVWVLAVGGEEIVCTVNSSPDFVPVSHRHWATIARGSERIETARRIWPEDVS